MNELVSRVITSCKCNIRVRYVSPVRPNTNAYLTSSKDLYTINIKKGLSDEQRILAFSHELVHVFQMIRGDLKIGWRRVSYRDLSYTKRSISKMLYQEYSSLPWEQEAFAKEHDLAMALIQKKDLTQFFHAETYCQA